MVIVILRYYKLMEDEKPVWQSKAWQAARKRLLKDKCSQCERTDKLSLVHLWKPPRYQSIRARIEQEILDKLITNNQIDPFDYSESEEHREACPQCQSVNLRQRKTKQPPFVCNRCGNQFEDTIEIIQRNEYLYRQTYAEWKKDKLQQYETEIEKLVKERQEDYNHQYKSGEGTTTLCGKCAYLWTQKGLKFCNNCKMNYHRRKYEQCYECYQQNQLVICEKCEEVKITPQIGGINICESCYQTMWNKMTK